MDSSFTNRRTVTHKAATTIVLSGGEVRADREPIAARAELLSQELRRQWARGNTLRAEEFFAANPEILSDPSAALEVIYEEVCLRERAGHDGVWNDVLQRFPQWRTELGALQDCHRLLEPVQAAPRFPEVGETLGEFRLLAELGRGALGRVFLATQPALAGRPVVLKLTPRFGQEHLCLARLQHTNIVPLYSAGDDRTRQLRLLCMPYLGNATLARLLEMLAPIALPRRTGKDLVAALDRLQETAPLPLARVPAARQFLARATYAQTISWIGACCADALHYAHERGLLHLDLKPTNLLIAADGQPMLLDFHLAHEPLQPGQPPPDELGGTSAYMPPEQRAAVDAVGDGRSVPAAVDGRADLYSLGAVLYEALGERLPSAGQAFQPLWRINPQVSVGLSDIIAKCLAADAEQRYADAAGLAADLRRHLTNQRLLGVANLNLAERWQKWRKRKPHAFRRLVSGFLLLGIATVFAVSVAFYFSERYFDGERALHTGQRQWQQGAHEEAVATLEHGLTRVQNLPGSQRLTVQLREQLNYAEEAYKAARRERLLRDLRHHVERLRMLLAIEGVAFSDLQRLEQTAGALWEKRLAIRESLSRGSDAGVDNDLLDLAICWTDLRVRLAPLGEKAAAHRQALQTLGDAESLCGPGAVLEQERQWHQRAMGRSNRAPRAVALAPRTVWERTAIGRSLLREGELEYASEELRQALDLEPHDPWSNYYYGLCAYRLKRFQDAALAFSVCVGSAPELPGCYYSRALALTALGRIDEAITDYNRTLQLEPGMAVALLNRGMLHYQQRRFDQALADLTQALGRGADPVIANYDLALVNTARGESAEALLSLGRALQRDPGHAESLRLRDKLRRN
jgi:serine/threonine protein kinase/Flp pilus assembly protein TadD